MTLSERFVGGNPRILTTFCLFSFVLSCFVGNYPSKIQENEKKNWAQNARSLARPVPAVAWPCLTMPCTPTRTRSLARPVPIVARPCQTPNHHIPIFFSFLLPSFFITKISHPSNHSLKISITKNLQTFISPSNLHQITNFFTQTTLNIIPNIIHQSNPTSIHPNQNSSKFLHPINLIQTPHILHQPTPLNSQTLLKHRPHN